jgi:arylformamidase
LFGNGGDLSVHGFRVDVPSRQAAEEEIAALFVASLGLLMTESVALSNVEVFAEPHKGTREDRLTVAAVAGMGMAGWWTLWTCGSRPSCRTPATTLLLAAGIPIVEHLTGLGQLPPAGARFTAAPPRIERAGSFPVRAFARLPR